MEKKWDTVIPADLKRLSISGRICPAGRERVNLLKTKLRLLYLKSQSVPRCKHFSSRLQKPISFCCKWHKLLVFSQINTKLINTVWAERRIVEC